MNEALSTWLATLVVLFGCQEPAADPAAHPGPEPRAPPAAAGPVLVEDFEQAEEPPRWVFSAGQEFPGAKGGFEISQPAARAGSGGGRLTFDFSGGGIYVAAVLELAAVPQPSAVRVWINNPSGNLLTLRYTDQTGQVHQKPFAAAGKGWSEVTIDLDSWEMHYGGANDGRINGPPRQLGFLVRNDGAKRGYVDLDDIRLMSGGAGSAAQVEESTYVALRWQGPGWSMLAQGNGGASRLRGSTLSYDFTQGASTIVLNSPQEALLGEPVELRVRLRGKAPGHPLRLHLATHLMTFEFALGELRADGEHELVAPAPPAGGWTWFGGENDGKLHGPLRIKGLLMDRGGKADRGEVELLDIRVKTRYPPQRPLILLADLGEKERAFDVLLRSLRPQVTPGVLKWVVRDWEGRALEQGSRQLSVPAGAEPLRLAVAVPDSNDPCLEAEFSFESGDLKVSPARAYRVAAIEGNPDNRPDPSSPFGMGVYLYRYHGGPGAAEGMDRATRLARQAGVRWTREVFAWELLEPARGKFDWRFYDELVAAARRHGLGVYGILCYWAPWTKPYSDSGIEDFCRYAAAVAERYRDDVQHWEVWNEPNIFFWQGPRDQYAKLLSRAYAAIKHANPSASVLGCATATIDQSFIADTLKLGAAFDILSVHPYRAVLDDPGFIAELREAAALVRLPDGASRPIWITEMGWATLADYPWSPGAQTSQRQQAELLARSYIDALASGAVENITWYDFRDDGQDPFNNEDNMGVMTHGLRPKPAYRALATVAGLLDGKRFERQLDLGSGVVAFRFVDRDGRRPVVAFWSTQEEQTAGLASPRPAKLINLMGQERPLAPVGGKLLLPARPASPAFALLDE